MMNRITKRLKTNLRGDTIVEVLIAIAVAAFAIGTSYAIANRSLQRAITARERNEAINNVQSQISALKFREKTDPSNFNISFSVPSGFSGPGTAFHFCLNPSANNPRNPDGTPNTNWPKITNNFSDDNQPTTLSVGSPGYDARCKFSSSSTDYYVDISAQVTTASQLSTNPTVYKVAVRWPGIGDGATQQSVVYYRF